MKACTRRIVWTIGAVLLLLLVWLAVSGAQAQEKKDKNFALVKGVLDRLLAEMERPPGYNSWPPRLEIEENDEPNAFALAAKDPVLTVRTGFIHKVCKARPEVMALTLGHELGHLHYHHLVQEKTVTGLVFNRQQELDADDFGWRLALRANYRYEDLVKNLVAWREQGGNYSSPEGLSTSHPTWNERLARLEKQHAQLWRSLGTFDSGTFFLTTEQYVNAEYCFRHVLKDFPKCPEAHANLGYALLMQYCDALEEKDLDRLGVGQLVVGGFYRRSAALEALIPRGENVKVWQEADKALSEALALKPDLALAKASRGVAFLVRPTALGGRDPARALDYLRQAAGPGIGEDLEAGTWSDWQAAYVRLVVFNNMGVAQLAADQPEEAAQAFERVSGGLAQFTSVLEKAARRKGPFAVTAPLANALRYNRALLALAKDREKERAADLLAEYLRSTPPASSWWPLAYKHYRKACGDLGRAASGEEDLKARGPGRFRLVSSVEVPAKGRVTLAEKLVDVQQRLGQPETTVPVIPGTDFRRLCYPDQGLVLWASDDVVVIALKGPKAPPLSIQPTGTGSRPQSLRVGMDVEELKHVLGSLPDLEVVGAPEETEDVYRVYHDVGVGVKIRKGKVVELLVVPPPFVFRL